MGDTANDWYWSWDGNPFSYIEGIRSEYDNWLNPTMPYTDAQVDQLTSIGQQIRDVPSVTTTVNAANAAAAKAQADAARSAADSWEQWFKANQNMILFGGLAIVLLLTRKK